jgi:chromosome segregation ATPase
MTQLGSIEHFEKIFNKIEKTAETRIEELELEIAKLKHYHKLELENYTDEIKSLKDYIKKDKQYIEYVENKYYELEKEIIELKKTD